MDLKCKKLDCKYNNKYSCMANKIDVVDTLKCTTYEHTTVTDPDQKQDVPKTMFKVTPKYHPYRHIKNIDVCCKAKCLFNISGKCKANGISISNDRTPMCYTYAKK